MSETKVPARGDKPAAILRAARELFLAHGFEGTSMDAVTEAAGVSKPTVYAHFGTKEALLEAVVQAEADNASRPTPFEATGDPRADLERVAILLTLMAVAPDALAWDRMMAGVARRRPEVGRTFYDYGPARMLAALADFFRDLNRAGGLSVPDPERAADFFFGLTLGVPMLRGQLCGDTPSQTEVDDRGREVAARFLRAYDVEGGVATSPQEPSLLPEKPSFGLIEARPRNPEVTHD